MNAIKSIVAVLLLSIVPLTAMGQKVKPDWAKPGSQQKKVNNELTVTNHGVFKSQLTIKEVMRAGNLVKITYTFKNLEKVSVPHVTVRSYGETSIGVFTDKKCEIVDMTFAGIGLNDMDLGKRGYITKTLKPGEIVEGVLYVSVDQTINKIDEINFNVFSYEYPGYIGDWRNKCKRSATYSFANVPIIQYTIQGSRVGNVDFTKPISTLPKKAPGLYDYMKKEENVNEMDGYTETRVKFYYGYDLVFEGVSTDEGPQKRFDEVTFYSSRFLTPNGCYPGMPMQEWVEKGAYLWTQYYETWTRVGSYWSRFTGDCADQTLKDALKLGYFIQQFFIDFERAHDKAMQKDPAAITKKALRKELFSEKNLLPSITIFIEK